MGTLIMGTALATVEQMRSYIRRVNPSVPQKVIDMLPFYLSEGEAEASGVTLHSVRAASRRATSGSPVPL